MSGSTEKVGKRSSGGCTTLLWILGILLTTQVGWAEEPAEPAQCYELSPDQERAALREMFPRVDALLNFPEYFVSGMPVVEAFEKDYSDHGESPPLALTYRDIAETLVEYRIVDADWENPKAGDQVWKFRFRQFSEIYADYFPQDEKGKPRFDSSLYTRITIKRLADLYGRLSRDQLNREISQPHPFDTDLILHARWVPKPIPWKILGYTVYEEEDYVREVSIRTVSGEILESWQIPEEEITPAEIAAKILPSFSILYPDARNPTYVVMGKIGKTMGLASPPLATVVCMSEVADAIVDVGDEAPEPEKFVYAIPLIGKVAKLAPLANVAKFGGPVGGAVSRGVQWIPNPTVVERALFAGDAISFVWNDSGAAENVFDTAWTPIENQLEEAGVSESTQGLVRDFVQFSVSMGPQMLAGGTAGYRIGCRGTGLIKSPVIGASVGASLPAASLVGTTAPEYWRQITYVDPREFSWVDYRHMVAKSSWESMPYSLGAGFLGASSVGGQQIALHMEALDFAEGGLQATYFAAQGEIFQCVAVLASSAADFANPGVILLPSQSGSPTPDSTQAPGTQNLPPPPDLVPQSSPPPTTASFFGEKGGPPKGNQPGAVGANEMGYGEQGSSQLDLFSDSPRSESAVLTEDLHSLDANQALAENIRDSGDEAKITPLNRLDPRIEQRMHETFSYVREGIGRQADQWDSDGELMDDQTGVDERIAALESIYDEAKRFLREGKLVHSYWVLLHFRLSIAATPAQHRMPSGIQAKFVKALIASGSWKTHEATRAAVLAYQFKGIGIGNAGFLALSASPRVLAMPSSRGLFTFSEINRLYTTNIYELGLTVEPTRVDGQLMYPLNFFLHDAVHMYEAVDCLSDSPEFGMSGATMRKMKRFHEIYQEMIEHIDEYSRSQIEMMYFATVTHEGTIMAKQILARRAPDYIREHMPTGVHYSGYIDAVKPALPEFASPDERQVYFYEAGRKWTEMVLRIQEQLRTEGL